MEMGNLMKDYFNERKEYVYLAIGLVIGAVLGKSLLYIAALGALVWIIIEQIRKRKKKESYCS